MTSTTTATFIIIYCQSYTFALAIYPQRLTFPPFCNGCVPFSSLLPLVLILLVLLVFWQYGTSASIIYFLLLPQSCSHSNPFIYMMKLCNHHSTLLVVVLNLTFPPTK